MDIARHSLPPISILAARSWLDEINSIIALRSRAAFLIVLGPRD
jgi:hypothetical protein